MPEIVEPAAARGLLALRPAQSGIPAKHDEIPSKTVTSKPRTDTVTWFPAGTLKRRTSVY